MSDDVEQMVEILSDLIDDALAGRLKGFAMVMAYSGDSVGSCYSQAMGENYFQALGMIEDLKQRMVSEHRDATRDDDLN